MNEIKRDIYLNKLVSRKENGLIKTITGIRRCGKSYLLDPLFKNYLLESGVKADHIIKLELDRNKNKKYLDPHALDQYIMSQIKDKDMYYILLDEIQLVNGFESVLNGFLRERNLDVYVTGSNSKFLSSDIITEF
ncbi:MAG: AAA family ATPase, partial [Clostridia bacterium]|nr:AAA family ATPase [Clostridia bacterium]